MPRPIPYYDLIFHILRYLVNRQIKERPTTLYQMSKRMGYGVEHIQSILEREKVGYVFINHSEAVDDRTTEILIKSIPQSIVIQLGIDNQKIEAAFISILESIETDEKLIDRIDPIAKYRIEDRAFEVLKPHLISWRKLSQELVRRGYPKHFVWIRLTKENLYENLSPVWRPYYYKRNIYFLKKCLQHTRELAPYFKPTGTAKVRRNKHKKYTPENPGLFNRSKKSV